MTEMIASQGALMPSEMCLFSNKGRQYGFEHEDFYFNTTFQQMTYGVRES